MLLQFSGGQFKLAVHILGVKNTRLLITFLNLVFLYVKNKWQQHSIRFFTPTCGQTESKGQTYETYTNWRPGQYLTLAHSHITRAVAAMDSCLALTDLTGTHQHGISSRQSYECTKPCFHGCQSTAWFMLLWVQFACCRNAPESFLKAYPLERNGNSRDHRFRPRLHGETLPRVKGSLATLGEPRASQLSIPRRLHKKQKAGTARSVPRLDSSTCHPFVQC